MSVGYHLPVNDFLPAVAAVPGGAPSNFTAIGLSSTSIHLEWKPPAKPHRNGEIVLYEMLYHLRSSPTADYTLNTTDMSMIVEGLETLADYNFQIRAYTAVGAGPWSSRLPFRTFAHCEPALVDDLSYL